MFNFLKKNYFLLQSAMFSKESMSGITIENRNNKIINIDEINRTWSPIITKRSTFVK